MSQDLDRLLELTAILEQLKHPDSKMDFQKRKELQYEFESLKANLESLCQDGEKYTDFVKRLHEASGKTLSLDECDKIIQSQKDYESQIKELESRNRINISKIPPNPERDIENNPLQEQYIFHSTKDPKIIKEILAKLENEQDPALTSKLEAKKKLVGKKK